MAKKQIKTSAGVFTPGDRNHLGTGGQASVYEHKGLAVKIYTDTAGMIPQKKITELMQIQEPRVIRPNGFAYDASSGEVVGYTMPLLEPADCEVACKFFTAVFRKDHGLGIPEITGIAKILRQVVGNVHKANCLVVDMNELNILVRRLGEPLIIDTDSFQTPSFPATAIMESIRDFSVQNNRWSPGSDWFSWGIIVFQMMVGIHPFKGSHPRYKMKEWSKRMKDGVSVFDKDAQLPPVCPPFTVIPSRLRGWFEDVFQKGQRSEPPDPDSSAPTALPPAIVIVKSQGKFKVTELKTFGHPILDVVSVFGTLHVLTKQSVFRGDKLVGAATPHQRREAQSRVVPLGDNGTLQATWNGVGRGGEVVVRENGVQLDVVAGSGVFVRHGCVYTVGANETMTEISFARMGGRTLASTKSLDGLIGRSAKLFDGVILHTMLGKVAAVMPFAPGQSVNRIMPELDGYRIVDAQAHWPTLAVIGEKSGKFDRLVFGFKTPEEVRVRVDQDIAYNGINMCVTPAGLCIMLLSDTELGLCKANDPARAQVVADPPIDTSMKLFADPTGAYFVNGNSIFRIEVT